MSYELPTYGRDGVAPFAWPTRALVHSVAAADAEGWLTEAHLLAAACLVAEDAREHAVPVQHTLIALKREWTTGRASQLLDVTHGRDLLDALVTACIKAYYELPGATPWAAPRSLVRATSPQAGEPAPPAPMAADVAATLLHVIRAVEPARPGEDADARDAEVTARLARALACVPAGGTTELIEGLRGLLLALRREHRPSPRSRPMPGARFQPPVA